MTIYLDTHVLVWLVQGEIADSELPPAGPSKNCDLWFRPPSSWRWNYSTRLAGLRAFRVDSGRQRWQLTSVFAFAICRSGRWWSTR